MRRLLMAAALIAAPMTAHAPLEYKVDNVVNVANGFDARVLFRNANTYESPTITAIQILELGVSSRARALCVVGCSTGGGGRFGIEGNVQTGTIDLPGADYRYDVAWSEGSCSQLDCARRFYEAYPGIGVLGCQAPIFAVDMWYVGRTCLADGFDGWLTKTVTFRYGPRAGFAHDFTFDASDLVASAFLTTTYRGPSAIVTPEPSTYALMAAGLLAVGVAVRRRDRTGTRTA